MESEPYVVADVTTQTAMAREPVTAALPPEQPSRLHGRYPPELAAEEGSYDAPIISGKLPVIRNRSSVSSVPSPSSSGSVRGVAYDNCSSGSLSLNRRNSLSISNNLNNSISRPEPHDRSHSSASLEENDDDSLMLEIEEDEGAHDVSGFDQIQHVMEKIHSLDLDTLKQYWPSLEEHVHCLDELLQGGAPKLRTGSEWNRHFQEAMALQENTLAESWAKYSLITKLSQDFVSLANAYGRTIVSELCLPQSKRTIKCHNSIGGLAGGDKYLVDGILFKLAQDKQVGDHYIYGGSYPHEELAAKAAGNELNGAINYFNFEHARGQRTAVFSPVMPSVSLQRPGSPVSASSKAGAANAHHQYQFGPVNNVPNSPAGFPMPSPLSRPYLPNRRASDNNNNNNNPNLPVLNRSLSVESPIKKQATSPKSSPKSPKSSPFPNRPQLHSPATTQPLSQQYPNFQWNAPSLRPSTPSKFSFRPIQLSTTQSSSSSSANSHFPWQIPINANANGDSAAQVIQAAEEPGLQTGGQEELHPLCVPMTALVDYHGFRLLAIALLPLDPERTQPVYGSSNAGKNVYASNPDFNRAMEAAGRYLHLRPHSVGGTVLASAGDVEGHVGTDGRFYLIDLGRSMPPESPVVCSHLPMLHNSIFSRLMRPEFLQYLKRQGTSPPLSPDALSGWGRHDENAEKLNDGIHHATEILVRQVIPQFATWLRKSTKEALRQLQLAEEFHIRGINLRHAGLVRALVMEVPPPENLPTTGVYKSRQPGTLKLRNTEALVRSLKSRMQNFETRQIGAHSRQNSVDARAATSYASSRRLSGPSFAGLKSELAIVAAAFNRPRKYESRNGSGNGASAFTSPLTSRPSSNASSPRGDPPVITAAAIAAAAITSGKRGSGRNSNMPGLNVMAGFGALSSSSTAAALLLLEIVKRTLKNMLRAWLRVETRAKKDPSQHAIIATTVSFLNLVSGSAYQPFVLDFWNNGVTTGIEERFGSKALTVDERRDLFTEFRVAGSEGGTAAPGGFLLEVIEYVLKMCGMRLTWECALECRTRSLGAYNMIFTNVDVLSEEARVKHMSIVDYSRGRLLMIESALRIREQQAAAAARLRSLAIKSFESALLSDPMSVAARKELAFAQAEHATLQGKGDEELLDRFFIRQLRLSISSTDLKASLLSRLLEVWRDRRSRLLYLSMAGAPSFALWKVAVEMSLALQASIAKELRSKELEAETAAIVTIRRTASISCYDALSQQIRHGVETKTWSTEHLRNDEIARQSFLKAMNDARPSSDSTENGPGPRGTLPDRFLRHLGDLLWKGYRPEETKEFLATASQNAFAKCILSIESEKPLPSSRHDYGIDPKLLLASMLLEMRANANLPVDPSTRSTPLMVAARSANIPLARFLLASSASDLEHKDTNSRTPLLLACAQGSLELVQDLLEYGAQIGLADRTGMHALHFAAASGNTALVEFLIKGGYCPLDAVDFVDQTALYVAIDRGHLESAKLLLAAKTDPSLNPARRPPALHALAAADPATPAHYELVRMLLSDKVDVGTMWKGGHALQSAHDSQIYLMLLDATIASGKVVVSNPLVYAASDGRNDVLQTLLERGYDHDACTQALFAGVVAGHALVVQLLLDLNISPSVRDENGVPALVTALRCEKDDVIKTLLVAKADPDMVDGGERVLFLAVKAGSENGVCSLIEAKATVQIRDEMCRTPLHWAARCGQLGTTKVLIDSGEVPLDAEDQQGRTCLHYAAGQADSDVVTLLLSAKMDPWKKDKNGCTALAYCRAKSPIYNHLLRATQSDVAAAVATGNFSRVMELVPTTPIDILNAPGGDLWTPLHHAVSNNFIEITHSLLDAKVDVDPRDGKRRTPLYWAARKGNVEVLSSLLQARADPRAHDRDGRRPIYWALKNSHTEIARMLDSYSGKDPGASRLSEPSFVKTRSASSASYTSRDMELPINPDTTGSSPAASASSARSADNPPNNSTDPESKKFFGRLFTWGRRHSSIHSRTSNEIITNAVVSPTSTSQGSEGNPQLSVAPSTPVLGHQDSPMRRSFSEQKAGDAPLDSGSSNLRSPSVLRPLFSEAHSPMSPEPLPALPTQLPPPPPPLLPKFNSPINSNPAFPRPNVMMRTLFWEKVSETDDAPSIWSRLGPVPTDFDFADFERHFRMEGRKVPGDRPKAKPQKASVFTAALDAKYRHSLGIFLRSVTTQVGKFCVDLIFAMQITDAQATEVLKFLPTTSALAAIQVTEVDPDQLSEVDRYLWQISFIPDVETRISLTQYWLRFPRAVQQLRTEIRQFIAACNAVMENQRLRSIFAIVLSLGNYMNEGTPSEKATGFRVSSLAVLSMIRSTEETGREPLLSYVWRYIDQKCPDLHNVYEELSPHFVVDFEPYYVNQFTGALEEKLEQLREYLRQHYPDYDLEQAEEEDRLSTISDDADEDAEDAHDLVETNHRSTTAADVFSGFPAQSSPRTNSASANSPRSSLSAGNAGGALIVSPMMLRRTSITRGNNTAPGSPVVGAHRFSHSHSEEDKSAVQRDEFAVVMGPFLRSTTRELKELRTEDAQLDQVVRRMRLYFQDEPSIVLTQLAQFLDNYRKTGKRFQKSLNEVSLGSKPLFTPSRKPLSPAPADQPNDELLKMILDKRKDLSEKSPSPQGQTTLARASIEVGGTDELKEKFAQLALRGNAPDLRRRRIEVTNSPVKSMHVRSKIDKLLKARIRSSELPDIVLHSRNALIESDST